MRGLKTQENERFNHFWQLIQDQAAQMGCVFFGFAGEGRDFSVDDMEGEDFSGWLVPADQADAFETVWASRSDASLFEENRFQAKFAFAIWRKEGGHITIEWKLSE